jgi:hypothetical protein
VALWPFVASTLHEAFLAGETGSAHIVVITWDASVHGWCAVIQWWANCDGKVVVGSLPASPDMFHQVRRETLAGVLAFEAADRLIDLSDATVILSNNAVGALVAFHKGSFSSTFLQQCSMRLAQAMAPVRVEHPFCACMPPAWSSSMRASTTSPAMRPSTSPGPATDPYLRQRIHSLLAHCGWTIAVDAFASTDNALTPRFFARYAEPAAEAEDAFVVPDWAVSLCPHCGSYHREVLYAFPPSALVNRFVAKASADGLRAIVVMPLAVSTSGHIGTNCYISLSLRTTRASYGPGVNSQRHLTPPPASTSRSSVSIPPRSNNPQPAKHTTVQP